MQPLRIAALTLISAFAIAACTEETVGPTSSESEALSFEQSSGEGLQADVTTTDRHLVVFRKKSGVPGGFAGEVAALGGEVDVTIESVGAAVVSGLDADAAGELSDASGVDIVEPELAFAIPQPTAEPEPVEASAEAAPASPEEPATAFFFPRQWNMRAIQADAAWDEDALGSSDVTVAILDTGIGYQHLDLDGLVDLSRSASFIPDDDALVDTFFPGQHPITDLHFHGTHVAATVSSNALAAAGVTSQTTLIGAKVCSVFGTCPGGAIMAGIEHAVQNDADIINMSLGGSFLKSDEDFRGFVSAINRLFNSAKQGGASMVVSAGNDTIDLDHNGNQYSTYCDAPHVVCVSATGPTIAESVDGPFDDVDALAPYSNFGRSAISVAAPGGIAVSEDHGGGFVWAACSPTSLVVVGCESGGAIIGVIGTSMASPHAAGVAALLAANGASQPSQIASRIQQTADDLGQSGTDPEYGKGRVNALNAAQ